MAIRIKFDVNKNALPPTLVLMRKSGKKIGKLPAVNIQFNDALNEASEGRFDIYKASCAGDIWNNIVDFKLVWAKEWNAVYELAIDEQDDKGKLYKQCSVTALGKSELSQINLYEMEVNTEDDIARDDYEPTVLYNSENPKASLLNRILEKAPHYTIGEVEQSIAGVQRTFQWDEKSIYDAFMEIAEEVDCLFKIDCSVGEDGTLQRTINVYDLESYCFDCQKRGNFLDKCDYCGSTNIKLGYGEDTTILISSDNLADSITFKADTGSVKNCFRLTGGDDLMTATIKNCNPNGSSYIYYISDAQKADMSPELVTKIEAYDSLYDDYQTTHTYTLNNTLRNNYNTVARKYATYTSDYPEISGNSIVGYPSLMELYYEAIGFYYFLSHSFMPTISMDGITAQTEATKLINTLNSSYSNTIGVRSLTGLSLTTANSAVTQMAKSIVYSAYDVKVSGTATLTYESNKWKWRGKLQIVNYGDEEDTFTTGTITLTFSDDYEKYVKQSIDRTVAKKNTDTIPDMVTIFDLSNTNFTNELKKYSLACLNSLHDACQSCVDILIEQGVADGVTWGTTLYQTLYRDGYYAKLGFIETELQTREAEVGYINAVLDAIEAMRKTTHDALDFENYVGETLWLEFTSFRREDSYKNDNFISDGLSDAELFANALEFIDMAKKEIYNAAELQHSISASLKNLLVMPEFAPILDYFEVGNFIRVKIDGSVHKLRLLSYEVNFADLTKITVNFSDVQKTADSITDLKQILSQASSMSSSYSNVKRQSTKGDKGYDAYKDWVANGLSLTNMKIVGMADSQDVVWDNHGILCREYLPYTDTYDDKQVKIINKGLYVTDDNWQTARTGVGNFVFRNPSTGQEQEAYGVISDYLVGNHVLSTTAGIYNDNASIVMNGDGITIKNGSTIVFSADTSGNLSLTGTINANAGSIGGFVIDSTSIHTNGKAVTSADTNSVALSSDVFKRTINSVERNNLKFAIGGNFGVDNTGKVYASSAVISGNITASSGTIGGWTANSSYGLYTNGKTLSTSTNSGILIQKDGGIYAGAYNSSAGACPFQVTSSGVLTASSATITGVINANTGYIGGTNGWTITTNAIYNGCNSMSSTTTGTYIGAGANGGIRQYSSSTSYVNIANGKVTAVGAEIKGDIKADTGYIGGSDGWTIKEGAIYSGTTSLSDATHSGTYIGTDGIRNVSTENISIKIADGKLIAVAASKSDMLESGLVVKSRNGSNYVDICCNEINIKEGSYQANLNSFDLIFNYGTYQADYRYDGVSLDHGSNHVTLDPDEGIKVTGSSIVGYDANCAFTQSDASASYVRCANTKNNVRLTAAGSNHSYQAGLLHAASEGGYTTSKWLIYIQTDGTVVANTASDRRVKDEVSKISDFEANAVLSGVEPINFTYKSNIDPLERTVNSGIYAQDLRDVLINNNLGHRGYLTIINKDEDDTTDRSRDIYADEDFVEYGIDYAKLVPVLIKGWQMHEARIKELEEELKGIRK